jgi:pilus assembly protein Flp/PilA
MDDNLYIATHKNQTLQGEERYMTRINNILWTLKIWKDTRGQDLIEYALMVGFVAVAAGAVMPGVSTQISTIFSKITSSMTVAAGS